MKKIVISLLTLSILTISTFGSKKSEAAVTILVLPVPVVNIVAGVLTVLSIADLGRPESDEPHKSTSARLMRVVLWLENDGPESLSLKDLNDEDAAMLGLTTEEHEAYLDNLEIFNAMLNEMEITSNDLTQDEIEQKWKEMFSDFQISVLAKCALGKILRRLFNPVYFLKG